MNRFFEDRLVDAAMNYRLYQIGYWKGVSAMLSVPAIIGITWSGITIGRLVERYSKRPKEKEQDE